LGSGSVQLPASDPAKSWVFVFLELDCSTGGQRAA
jgi:hypothetical protein